MISAVRFTDSVDNRCCRIRGIAVPSSELLGYVRLKARVVGEVKVLFRQTLSGL